MFTEDDIYDECEFCEGSGIVWIGHGGDERDVPCPECNGLGIN